MRKLSRVALITALGLTAVPTAADAAFQAFQSPSGNIGCYISGDGARCDIREHDWPTPPRPASCDLDYGGGLTVSKRGKGTFFCAGDTALGAGPKLAYGAKRSAGRFTCTSRKSGMHCINRRNGHGFLLSRQAAKRF